MLARTSISFAILLTLILVHALPACGEGEGSVGRLARLIPRKSRWALVVRDLKSDSVIAAAGNSLDESLVPGSLAKLFTTGAVLDRVEREGRPEAFLSAAREGKRSRKVSGEERLQRFLRDMNVHSRNRSAEALFLRLGELRFGAPATREKGEKAVGEFLAGLGLAADGVALVDGSGLSRENRVPARFVARYLVAIRGKPWFEKFRATLPRAGLEGTVKDIGYADPRFRVKSGRLDNAFALAGYGVARGGREVAFAYLVNVRFGRRITDRRHSRGEIVRAIARGAFR